MTVITETTRDPEKEYEVVAGEAREKEMGGARHGGVGARLLIRVGSFVEENELGGVYGPDTSFQIGANERLPDVSFVAAERIPPEGEPQGIWPFAPDLAVEIVSPTDIYERVYGKVLEYLAAGVRRVWLLSPEHRTVTVFHSPTRVHILSEADDLLGDDVLPGFRCRVGDIFRTPARA